MDFNTNIIKRLRFENFIWVIYLIIALFSIYGDELIIKSIEEKEDKYNEVARNIFLIILIVTLIVYLYFLNRNYNDFKNSSQEVRDVYAVRLVGSIFVYVGTICFLYFFINSTFIEESISNV